jgi:EthD domain
LQFQDYWLNKHGPLVASLADTLGIRRYVQLHSLPHHLSEGIRVSRNSPSEFDGVAQLWFDSIEAVRENGRRPEA